MEIPNRICVFVSFFYPLRRRSADEAPLWRGDKGGRMISNFRSRLRFLTESVFLCRFLPFQAEVGG